MRIRTIVTLKGGWQDLSEADLAGVTIDEKDPEVIHVAKEILRITALPHIDPLLGITRSTIGFSIDCHGMFNTALRGARYVGVGSKILATVAVVGRLIRCRGVCDLYYKQIFIIN